MRQSQSVIVYGKPRGKGRPRFSYHGTYTDAVTTEYEGRIKKAWKCENNFCFDKVPTTVIINAFFPVPVSLSKRKRQAMFGSVCLTKPDADNIAKIVLDALNGGVGWKDDSQVTSLKVHKRYVMTDEEQPRIEVTVIGG
jgi:Holliday junction resolvase RusA-like endonuclease